MGYNWYNEYGNECMRLFSGALAKSPEKGSVDSGFGSGVAFLKQRTVEYLFW